MKQYFLFWMMWTLCGCQTVKSVPEPAGTNNAIVSLDQAFIPLSIRNQLSVVRFDSNLNVIQRHVSTATADNAQLSFYFAATIKDDTLVGELVKDSSFVGFAPVRRVYPISLPLGEMCCDHRPIQHCTHTHQGMRDSTARYGCKGWTAVILH